MSVIISPALLRAVGAKAKDAEIFAPLLEAARVVQGDAFGTISSLSGNAMLVAQLAQESGRFSTLSENLNYQVAALRQGNRAKYFTQAQAEAFGAIKNLDGTYIRQANQRMIAALYYGGRNGNRGVSTSDGWDFRGGGLIQLTGRENYTKFAQSMGITVEAAANWVRQPDGAVASALWYWRTHGLLIPASKGDVTTCTQIITGGDHGLNDRIFYYKLARDFLKAQG